MKQKYWLITILIIGIVICLILEKDTLSHPSVNENQTTFHEYIQDTETQAKEQHATEHIQKVFDESLTLPFTSNSKDVMILESVFSTIDNVEYTAIYIMRILNTTDEPIKVKANVELLDNTEKKFRACSGTAEYIGPHEEGFIILPNTVKDRTKITSARVNIITENSEISLQKLGCEIAYCYTASGVEVTTRNNGQKTIQIAVDVLGIDKGFPTEYTMTTIAPIHNGEQYTTEIILENEFSDAIVLPNII